MLLNTVYCVFDMKEQEVMTLSVQPSAEPFNQKCIQTNSAFISDKNHKILHLSDRWLKWSYQGSAWGSQLWGCACWPPCFPLTSFMLVSVVDCGRWHLVQAPTAGAFWERWTKIQSSLGISWCMLNPSRGPDLTLIEYRNVLFLIWWPKSNDYAQCLTPDAASCWKSGVCRQNVLFPDVRSKCGG